MNNIASRLHTHLLDCGAQRDSFAASLAAICQGEIIERWTTGRTAEPAHSSAVNADTRFLVASLSKPVSATALMRLVDDNVVELSTPVHKLLPEFKAYGKEEIEIQHLLNSYFRSSGYGCRQHLSQREPCGTGRFLFERLQ